MTTWLIDKSALVRLAVSPDAAEWATRIESGLVRITTVTRLETGYSARSGPEMRAGFQRPPLSSIPVEYLTPAIEDRAVELLTLLADRGQHRAPSIPDLIVAATAELAGLTVLHLDKDFDLIAEITAQPMERLNMDSAAETGSDAEQARHYPLSFPIAAGAAGQRVPSSRYLRTLSWEPVSGLEPSACRLQEIRPCAPYALAAPMAQVIALIALAALGLSGGVPFTVPRGRQATAHDHNRA